MYIVIKKKGWHWIQTILHAPQYASQKALLTARLFTFEITSRISQLFFFLNAVLHVKIDVSVNPSTFPSVPPNRFLKIWHYF